MIETYTELCDKVYEECAEIYVYFDEEEYDKDPSDIDERLSNLMIYGKCVHFMISEFGECILDEKFPLDDEYWGLDDYDNYKLLKYYVEPRTYKRWDGETVTTNAYHALISKE